ncbi:MAG: hypothetical protein BWZ01_01507 [Deltaproteobacteria bacterium ADurb.BinA179]|nr:MAG: hypothetical protein BWZ01_01507 [Deltaproteobacteria bacterium ADurb.BinA179]
MKPIEPLAPAGNLACGKAASDRGADAARPRAGVIAHGRT